MTEPSLDRTLQQTIDRQVDGELSDGQSRELLAMLDGVDGGWRRLALAYVEAQWLRSELPSLVHAHPAEGSAASHRNHKVRGADSADAQPSRHPRLALMTLAVAASMLVAFGLSLWQRSTSVGPPAAATAPANGNTQVATGHKALANQPQNPPAVASIPDARIASPMLNVNDRSSPVVADQAPSSEPRMVVIGSDGNLSGPDSATVPPQVIEALRRLGHRVDQRSGVMPVRLKDGRSVNVPYDQVDVQYRGPSSFQ